MVMVWLRKFRDLGNLTSKLEKLLLALDFLQSCKKEKVIPKLLQFKVANKRLESSEAYLICQRRLLKQEISIKYKTIRTLYNKIAATKISVHNQTCFIAYVHVVTKFLELNDKNICQIRMNQSKKLHNLYLNNSYHNSGISHHPDKMVFNFSDHVLNTTEKSLLSKGLNFAIPPKDINYADFMLPCELLYSNVHSLEVSNLDKEFIKSTIRDYAFSSYKNNGKKLQKNLPKEKLDALKILLKNKDIIVEKADKGKKLVIMNRKGYVFKMKSILNNTSKLLKIYTDFEKILNHLIHMENRVRDVLKSLKVKK